MSNLTINANEDFFLGIMISRTLSISRGSKINLGGKTEIIFKVLEIYNINHLIHFYRESPKKAWNQETTFSYLILLLLFLREHEWEGEGSEGGERENIFSRLHSIPSIKPGSHKGKILTWDEIKNWMHNRLSHPGAPILNILKRSLWLLCVE